MAVHLNNIIKCEIKNTLNAELDFSKYVDHVKDFVPADNFDEEILADVESLGVFKKAKKGALSQSPPIRTRDFHTGISYLAIVVCVQACFLYHYQKMPTIFQKIQ